MLRKVSRLMMGDLIVFKQMMGGEQMSRRWFIGGIEEIDGEYKIYDRDCMNSHYFYEDDYVEVIL